MIQSDYEASSKNDRRYKMFDESDRWKLFKKYFI